MEHLKKSLKRGNENELVLAPKVLSLMSITLGTSSENLYKEIAPIYKEMINNGFSSDQAFSAVSFFFILKLPIHFEIFVSLVS